MQIISTMNKFLPILLLALSFSATVNAEPPRKDRVVVEFRDGAKIGIGILNKRVDGQYRNASHPAKVISIDKDLSAIVLKSSALAFLLSAQNNDKNLALIVAREPSRTPGGMGPCGAGLEDYIVLVEKADNTVSFKDKYLLQSCNESKALESDDPDNIVKSVSIDKPGATLSFRLLGDPENTRRRIYIENGKIVSHQH